MKIVTKWNGHFRSDRLERKKWSFLERSSVFVPGNFRLNRALGHFNRLNRKCWLNGKCPWPDRNNETEDSLPRAVGSNYPNANLIERYKSPRILLIKRGD